MQELLSFLNSKFADSGNEIATDDVIPTVGRYAYRSKNPWRLQNNKGDCPSMNLMKCLFFLILFSTAVELHGQYASSPLDTQTVNRSGLIALVQIEGQSRTQVDFSLKSLFKLKKCILENGTVKARRIYKLSATNYDIKFNLNESYLIFFGTNANCELVVDKNARILPEKEATTDIEFLNTNLPCQDKELKKEGPCHRYLFPLCGCDGVTYGNECEALRNGIVRFKVGACK